MGFPGYGSVVWQQAENEFLDDVAGPDPPVARRPRRSKSASMASMARARPSLPTSSRRSCRSPAGQSFARPWTGSITPRRYATRAGALRPRDILPIRMTMPRCGRLSLHFWALGGSGRYRVAVFDHRSDSPVAEPERHALPASILVLDGIFLHRPELRDCWDFHLSRCRLRHLGDSRCAESEGERRPIRSCRQPPLRPRSTALPAILRARCTRP